MKVTPTKIPDVLVVEPRVFPDDRGYFFEAYHADRYAAHGIHERFVQDNVSFSRKGVLRGLHYQHPNEQGKLVSVLSGEVFDVAADIRRDSPTFGQWIGVRLSAENHQQLYVPPGFAHGFVVLSDTAIFTYKCTAFYDPSAERIIRWDDASLAIDWPVREPQVAARDLQGLPLSSVPRMELPGLASDSPAR